MAKRGRKMPWLYDVTFYHLRSSGLTRSIALAASLTVLILGTTSGDASKKMRPLTHAEVSRIWIGISEDELYIFRLSLASGGGGFGAYSFLDDEPHTFRISSWKYDPPSIHITIEPVGQSTLVTGHLSGNVSGVGMHLRMSGKGWSRSLSFRREEDLVGRWSRIKEAMARLKNE